jgi:hypothetical protein
MTDNTERPLTQKELERKALMEGFLRDKRAEAEAKKSKKEETATTELEDIANKHFVQSGINSLNSRQLPTNEEGWLHKQGQENVGKNPEEVVIGKRTDWDHK